MELKLHEFLGVVLGGEEKYQGNCEKIVKKWNNKKKYTSSIITNKKWQLSS